MVILVAPICTTGYAISRRGAQRLLYHLGSLGPKEAVDLDIMDLTMGGMLSYVHRSTNLTLTWLGY
jgi:hypothetical protein